MTFSLGATQGPSAKVHISLSMQLLALPGATEAPVLLKWQLASQRDVPLPSVRPRLSVQLQGTTTAGLCQPDAPAVMRTATPMACPFREAAAPPVNSTTLYIEAALDPSDSSCDEDPAMPPQRSCSYSWCRFLCSPYFSVLIFLVVLWRPRSLLSVGAAKARRSSLHRSSANRTVRPSQAVVGFAAPASDDSGSHNGDHKLRLRQSPRYKKRTRRLSRVMPLDVMPMPSASCGDSDGGDSNGGDSNAAEVPGTSMACRHAVTLIVSMPVGVVGVWLGAVEGYAVDSAADSSCSDVHSNAGHTDLPTTLHTARSALSKLRSKGKEDARGPG